MQINLHMSLYISIRSYVSLYKLKILFVQLVQTTSLKRHKPVSEERLSVINYSYTYSL